MNNDDLLKLDNQLCFSVYALSREITKMYRPLLDELGITYPQYLVLLVLWESGESTVKELGEQLFLDSGTLTPLLKRMQDGGLIVRERSSVDERRVLIKLTEDGKLLQEKAICIPMSLIDNGEMSSNELVSMRKLVQQLLNQVHQINTKK
ncbi:MarR family winged helix-turn-helix transcriptional regulator [Cytobacillus sp. Hm23]